MRRKETKPEQDCSKLQRINKVISSTGLCSRRKVEEYISQGRVSVNGKIINEQGFKVDPENDSIKVDNKKLYIIHDRTFRYYVLNKPTGYISSKLDPEGRPIVYDLLPKKFRQLNAVGRLDFNTEGILLFTNDGNLLNKLSHPKYKIRRRYLVRAKTRIDENMFRKIATEGTLIDGDLVTDIGFADLRYTNSHTWFEIEIGEGKNKEVKKIVINMGAEVSRLKRIAYGTIYKSIPPKGKGRELTKEEVDSLYELVKG